ncbi:MAG: DMP19 family protein [Prevotella sp.]|nr:DMP19 family protein [Prevotella sp.]
MNKVIVTDASLREAAEKGIDKFLGVFVDAILDSVGGELTAETMGELNAEQITLVAYHMLHEEVMEGGFIQLIHNGLGPFIFLNPFAKMLRLWGLRDLSKMVYNVHTLYKQHHDEIEADCSDEEFMALYERFPEFEEYDDDFIENEEAWNEMMAHYVDENIEKFATIA